MIIRNVNRKLVYNTLNKNITKNLIAQDASTKIVRIYYIIRISWVIIKLRLIPSCLNIV